MVSRSIKEVALEIKEIVFNDHKIDTEKFLNEISKSDEFNFEDLRQVYNSISAWKLVEEQLLKVKTSSKKASWTKGEESLVAIYSELAKKEINEEGKNKTNENIIDELCIVLNRSFSSINNKYYGLKKKPKEAKKKKNNQSKITSTVNTEIVNQKESTQNNDQTKSFESVQTESQPQLINNIEDKDKTQQEKTDDLLDMVIGFVENVDDVGIDINAFFKGLLTLSQKAVENNKKRIDELEGEVAFYKEELSKEKAINDNMQTEVNQVISEFEKLKKEIAYFDNLDGKQKLQQLHSYNKKLRYMVDQFGGVITVGNGQKNAV